MKVAHQLLLVDDHDFVRCAIRRMLEVEPDLRVCAEASTREQALHLIRTKRPHAVLLDLMLGREDGFSFIQEVRRLHPHLPVLILSLHKETLFAEPALRAGADGYLMKSDASEHLIEAVRSVLNHHLYVSPVVQQSIFDRMRGLEQHAKFPGAKPVRRKPARRPVRTSAR